MSRCTSLNGMVKTDFNPSIMEVKQNFTSCKGIASQTQTRANRTIVLNEQPTTIGNYTIAPSGVMTIVKFSDPISYNTQMNISVNNSNAYVGDEMLWVIDFSKVGTSLINVPVSSYYYLTCGEISESVNSDDFFTPFLSLPWIFDGQKWLSTWDNC